MTVRAWPFTSSRRNAAVACVPLVCVLLIFGWWPFGSPPNDVTWAPGENAVRFGKRATILSSGPLAPSSPGTCTIELWLQPRLRNASGTVLGFYGHDGLTGISLHQSLTDLRLDSRQSAGRPVRLYINDIFLPQRLVFVTIVAEPQTVSVYRDAWLVRSFPNAPVPRDACSGRFVVGDSPEEDATFEGEFRGLAIHGGPLTADQVRASYWSWRKYGTPRHSGNPQPQALYLFNEQRGRQIADRGAAGVNLLIPERYAIAQKVFLKSPFQAFQFNPGYFRDLLINVAGFVPLGFLVAASLPHRCLRAVVLAALAGFAVSLAIELGQMYLPTRNSDSTDLLTNTFGAALGAVIQRYASRRLTTHPR